MKRANQFDVRPRSAKEREVFVRWLDASASLWNETNYARRQAFLEDNESVCEEYGIAVEEESEAWTSQECPECGEREETIRHEDSLTCPCGFEGHADLVASESFLRQQTNAVGSMARPVYLKWNKHSWRDDHSPPSIAVETTANEDYTNQSTTPSGKVASVETQDD